MAAAQKQDSNATGLRYAEEVSIGVLGGSPIWFPLEPNSYNDFGGQLTTVARNPINDSRQRKKGNVTDLDAAGGFNTDLTQTNIQDLLQGFFFANARTKLDFTDTITNVDGTGNDYEAAAGLDSFATNDLVFASGFAETANNGLKTVTAAAAASLTVSETIVDETPGADAKLVKVGSIAPADDLGVDASGDLPVITSTVFDFTNLGLVEGEWIFVGGDTSATQFQTAANNGFKRVRSIAANALTLDKSTLAMVTEVLAGGETVHIYIPRTVKNELGTSIVRRSYNLERTLGAPDDALPTQIQSEYITGAVPNELTFNIPTADKLNADLSFVGLNNEQRTGAEGVKAGSRPALVEADMFNTSSDVKRIKMAVVTPGVEAPTALFAFVTDATIAVNNNITPNKAVGVLGAFDVTAGTFQVGGSVTAYFSDVAAVQAVRNNSDVTIDIQLVKENAGAVIDIPLLALGEGRINVEQDAPITLPLSMDAATAAKIDANLDYTLMICNFDYLPDAADT